MLLRVDLVKQLENLFFGVLRRHRHVGQQRYMGLADEIIQPHIFVVDLHQQVLGPGRVVDPQHELLLFEVRVRAAIFTSFRLFRRVAEREFHVGVLLAHCPCSLGFGLHTG